MDLMSTLNGLPPQLPIGLSPNTQPPEVCIVYASVVTHLQIALSSPDVHSYSVVPATPSLHRSTSGHDLAPFPLKDLALSFFHVKQREIPRSYPLKELSFLLFLFKLPQGKKPPQGESREAHPTNLPIIIKITKIILKCDYSSTDFISQAPTQGSPKKGPPIDSLFLEKASGTAEQKSLLEKNSKGSIPSTPLSVHQREKGSTLSLEIVQSHQEASSVAPPAYHQPGALPLAFIVPYPFERKTDNSPSSTKKKEKRREETGEEQDEFEEEHH
jgi:hypothetical protein